MTLLEQRRKLVTGGSFDLTTIVPIGYPRRIGLFAKLDLPKYLREWLTGDRTSPQAGLGHEPLKRSVPRYSDNRAVLSPALTEAILFTGVETHYQLFHEIMWHFQYREKTQQTGNIKTKHICYTHKQGAVMQFTSNWKMIVHGAGTKTRARRKHYDRL